MNEVDKFDASLELIFPVHGTAIPIDHSYELFSSVCKAEPLIHEIKNGVLIHSISGRISHTERIIEIDGKSFLVVRVATHLVPILYRLANKRLRLRSYEIRLGVPTMNFITPSRQLFSRITVIKGQEDPRNFLSAVQRQLARIDVAGRAVISTRADGSLKRKTLKIKNYTVIGYGLTITHLSENDSIVLQSLGIGGKGKLGCGFFVSKR